MAHYVGGGMQWLGPLPTRDDDIFGVGAFHAEFSDEAGLPNDGETALEIFYRAQVAGWLSLKPDFQYIFNPGGSNAEEAIVVGLRAEVAF